MHLFRNDNNKSKSRTSRLLFGAMTAALTLVVFSAVAFANSDNKVASENRVIENNASVAVKTRVPDVVTPTPKTSADNSFKYYFEDDGILDIRPNGTGNHIVTEDFCEDNLIGRSAIKEIILQDNVTGIDNYAFADCTGLKNVTIKEEDSFVLGPGAFDSCQELKTLRINSSVVDVKSGCFYADSGVLVYVTELESDGLRIEDGAGGAVTYFVYSDSEAQYYTQKYKSMSVGEFKKSPDAVGGVSYSVRSNGAMFDLVFKFEPDDQFEYMIYDIFIDGERKYPDDNGYLVLPKTDEKPKSAKNITDTYSVKIEMHAYGQERTFVDADISVASCLQDIIAKTTDANAKALAKKMLCYGAAAQVYFQENQENLANAGVTGAQFDDLSDLPDTIGTYDGTSLDFSLHLEYSDYAGITLRFTNELQFYMFFKVKDNCTSSQAIQELLERYNLEGADKVQKNEYVVLHKSATVTGLSDTLFSFSILDNASYDISVMDYLVKVQNSTTASDSLKILCKALYALGTSATA